MNKGIYSVLFSAILMTLSAASVSAAGSETCQPTYGGVYGGSNCAVSKNLTIDKKVQNPQSGVFVDNMSVNDAKFAPEQAITFKIVVTNTGDANLDNVTIKDIFPQYVTFSGGAGSYDSATNTLTLTLDGLKAGESRTFTVGGKVAAQKDLSNNMISCVINQAQAITGDITVSDNAHLCIEKNAKPTTPSMTKGGLPIMPAPAVETTPSTGPEMALLFGLIPLGGFGYFLRRKTSVQA